ncbi:hypothetical protein [Natrarchaeobaculum aegyptiacum]|uniref:Galactose-1-phosphate uridylyltransferase n=1 Tax=Natrarchaeobaculum aegyptiacum TaxID=745377 RepID=A0A2Z2HST9_9EURY|nr:hypothetical protein [Natrarchaeobaculum aegyptiacum]ARS89843.1 hypothetical protein B1756_08900 [Natrarchaeobaculum aegyptiacum]
MGLEFTAHTDEARFDSPMVDFEEDTVEIEFREDPLTGQQTRIVEQVFPGADERPDLPASVTDADGCFFCPDMVHDATPEYPEFVDADRLEVGDSVSFPNLFPYAEHANVVVLTEDHFLPIEEFSASVLGDGLANALEYVHAVSEHASPAFASINMNLLPSSGSSVVHPHMQAIVDDHGTNETRRRVTADREYLETNGQSYWDDLLEAERGGERYVGATGDVEWVAPFAPRHHWHVVGVADVTGLPAPDDDVVADLARGLENVLTYYGSLGLNAHNFTVHLHEGEASPVTVDVVARAPLSDHYVTDAFFMHTLHDERVVDVAPETYAPEVAEQF